MTHPSETTAPPSETVDVTVVVTLFNEQATVAELARRAVVALEPLGRSFELVFVDDGSTDGSFLEVERLAAADPRIRGVRFKRNFGQHPAMHAGLARARGAVIVTMDGDLQNPPEELPRLLAALDEHHVDVASGRRAGRQDSFARTLPSRLVNGMLRRFTGVHISDFGCAYNAYRRDAILPLLGSIGKQKFTKALVLAAGATVVEVDVAHAARADASRYSPLRLAKLAAHVLVGFWPQPIQLVGVWLGVLCTIGGVGLGCYGIAFWIDRANFPGPLFGGVAVLLILGIQGFLLALVGEYLGRIRRDVEGRPLYMVDREI